MAANQPSASAQKSNICTAMPTMPPDEPYTVTFFACLATCILHTPRPKLQRFCAIDPVCSIASLDLDACSPQPDRYTMTLSRQLMSVLQGSENASPDTIPPMLSLLLRDRMLTNTDSFEKRDESLILIAAFMLAHKFLADEVSDYCRWGMMTFVSIVHYRQWDLIKAEWAFLKALDYRIWVKDDEFELNKKKFEELWADVYSKA
jgi:hypothetical protein